MADPNEGPRLTDPRALPLGILITRPEPGASETAARVSAMGLTPILAPMLDIRPLHPGLPRPDRIAAVLLTSGNAIAPLAPVWHGRPLFAVGDATARRARDAGWTSAESADGDAIALTTLVRERLRPADGPLLLAAGRGQSLNLAVDLRAVGFRVVRRAVYAAEPAAGLPDAARAALMAGTIRAALFFSTETARHFMHLAHTAGLVDRLRPLEAITIAAKVAMALEQSRWSRIRAAGKPNQDEMLGLLR